MAGAVIVHRYGSSVPTGTVAIQTTEPYAAWARVASLFYPVPSVSPGIHPSAIVAEGALVDPSAEVGPLSVIETGAEIGPGCQIGPCAVVAHASLSYALLGARVYVYPGAGSDRKGLGSPPSKMDFSASQLGRVMLEDDVAAGSRLDNLVRLATTLHSAGIVVSSPRSIGLSGLAECPGPAGHAAMAGHLRIGERAEVGAQAGVISDIAPGTTVLGSPAQPIKDFFRQIATLKKMAKEAR